MPGPPDPVKPRPRRVLPEHFGSYRLVREIGRGGQGQVYLAEDLKLGRKVALKVLTAVPALSPKAVHRFRREAEITAQLDHPGICTTYDCGDEDGMPWIAMRYVEGKTLATTIAEARSVGTAPSEQLSFSGELRAMKDPRTAAEATHQATRSPDEIAWVVRVVEQTARALHVAHENGFIHRDIKPANIMVTPEGSPVILDFGLANVVEPSGPTVTLTGDLMGTPQYMAPEHLTKDAIHVDRRADVYSLGITLYESLTLTRPFESPTREQLFQAILAKEPPDPRRVNGAISRDLCAVIATAIEKDRDRRYQTARDFADDLRRVLDREPVLARRPGPILRAMRWAERNPAVAIFAGSLLVVLVSGLLISLDLLGKRNAALAAKEKAFSAFENLSDAKRVRDLKAAAADLLPAVPSKLDAMKDWLERARVLIERRPLHEQALASLRAAAGSGRLSEDDQWRQEYLTELVRELESFDAPDPHVGVVADMKQRVESARTITKRSLDDFADRWRAAIDSIADRDRSPDYRGLRLRPQLGLVPLGQNPASRLWEFAVIDSGTLPGTDGRTSEFEFEDETAVVLVLLPGGTFAMGSKPEEPGRGEDETLHDVDVAPFFMGKYEVTQAQWKKITGRNPSVNNADRNPSITPAHPVEQIDWYEAAEFARRLAGVLPTEAQWEYACRAGTRTAFAFGDGPESLNGHSNVRDQSLVRRDGSAGEMIEAAPWDDGFSRHAPVSAFAMNGFGLFGLHGNVGEWCLDWYRHNAADNVVESRPTESRATSQEKCARDGSWFLPPHWARSAARHRFQPANKSAATGMRLARDLDR